MLVVTNEKRWFRLFNGVDGQPQQIVAASNEDEVKKAFRLYDEPYKVSQMTWGMMKEAVGCEIPYSKKPDDFASGQIYFKGGNYFYFLTIVV